MEMKYGKIHGNVNSVPVIAYAIFNVRNYIYPVGKDSHDWFG